MYKLKSSFTFKGKRYYIYGNTVRELEKKRLEKMQALEEGMINKTTTFSKWCDIWLKNYVLPSVSKDTYANTKSIIKPFLADIGGYKLDDICPLDLQKIINQKAGYSGSNLNKTKQVIKRCLQCAVDNGYIYRNPAQSLTIPKATDGTHRAITDEERKLILKVAETHKDGLWIKTMLYCGLRPSETALITYEDIKDGLLHIRGTKTDNADRFVPIPDLLQFGTGKGLIFKGNNGQPMDREVWRRKWANFKRALQVAAGCQVYRNQLMPPFPLPDDLTLYCLRHTYCTDLQTAGVPINIAKDLMGHSDIRTTSKIYTHLTAQSLKNTVDKINIFHSS